jgi:tellurite resistance protein
MASYEKRTWWSRHELTDRLKDETFLEAAVTCAFLVAASDGNQSEQEYDALLDRLEILGGVDRDRIDELLTAANQDVDANGFEPRIARVADLLSNKPAAEAALMLGLAIALADNDVSKEEREVATQLSAALGRGLLNIYALIEEIRGK